MTHHNDQDSTFQAEWCEADAPAEFQDLLMLLAEHGFDGMAQALQLLFNEAMKLERTAFLGAQPFERTPPHAAGRPTDSSPRRCGPASVRWNCVCRRRATQASIPGPWSVGNAANVR